ncbi:MAG: hypothetical protein ACOCP8_03590 [archaeon]
MNKKTRIKSMLNQSISTLEEIENKIEKGLITDEELINYLDYDLLNQIFHKSQYLYGYTYCKITGKKIYINQECYFSNITHDWYIDFEAAKKDHLKEGYFEEEINELNENLDIYFTAFPGEPE